MVAREERIARHTLVELEQEEQSLDRRRRWCRERRSRDLLGISATAVDANDLKRCDVRFDGYAERVYADPSQPDAPARDIDGRAGSR